MFDKVSEVLPLAQKPIRYTGGEFNARLPAAGDARVRWVLAMPEVYEIGMSNYGLRILYSIINRLPDASCERCFVPWPDFGELLQARELPLYALESKRPVAGFDILGISLQSELGSTNVPYLLDLAGIPLRREERNETHPLVIAGGPCTVNPLPLSRFFDALVVGDGEEVVRDISAAHSAWDRKHRDDLLKSLAAIDGVYVPGVTANEADAVRRRIVPELREEDFPFPPLVPICEVVHDRLAIEIARGCTRGCRFCQAGILNRPTRYRPVEEILSLAERGIRATGWEEVSLLSLSSLDYPDILSLVQRLNSRMKSRRVSISLPSTRGEDFAPELAFDLQEVKKAGLTFAPETASSRLKALVNKNIGEQATLESIRTALDAGWNGVKLYFMVGLPTETDADLDEISRFVTEIAQVCRGRAVRYNLNPFVPKPHTPLQWAGFAGIEESRAKIERVRATVTRRNTKAKWGNPESSFVEALLARGDERLGAVIERVYRNGGLFQEWTEHFRFDRWLEACAEEEVDPDAVVGPRTLDSRLDWNIVDVGVSKQFLAQEFERSQRGETTPYCSRDGCTGCGACPDGKPPEAPVKTAPDVAAYGRKSRPGVGADEPKTRFRLKYEVGDEYRFASHLDRVRSLYRTLRRSELPVIFTRGYSPKPMFSFGPPLPVGLTSSGEYVDVNLSVRYPGNLVRDLAEFLPAGLRIAESRALPRGRASLGKTVNLGRYRIDVPAEAQDGIEALVEKGKGIAGIRRLEIGGPGTVIVDLAIASGVRLLGVLAKLFEVEENAARCLRVRRLDCLVERDGLVSTPMED